MNEDLTKTDDDLFVESWEEHKTALKKGIEDAINRGKVDSDVLYIMKELLDAGLVKPKKKSIEEYFEEQEKKG